MNTHCTTEGVPSETLGNRKRSRLHALILLAIASLTMLLSGCFLTGGGGDGGGTGSDDGSDINLDSLIETFALTEEYLEYLKENPILVTPENSPGNPSFINVTFTDEDYAQAEGYAALVTPDMPEADFPEFGIHVNLKPWNLAFESDTLVVLRMPDKYDEATNSMLYTYDYFLLSGQDQFFTDVEVTAPVQGDPDAFMDFVTFNSQTGRWESVYTELAEDKRSFTAYMTHFTPGSQRNALDLIQTAGQGAIDLYQQDGKSIFIQLDKEMKPKYEGSSHYLYPVSVSRKAYLDDFFTQEHKNKLAVVDRIISETGNILPKDGLMTVMGWIGIGSDVGGNTVSGISFGKETVKAFKGTSSDALAFYGRCFTYVGIVVLALDVIDNATDLQPTPDGNKKKKEWGQYIWDNILGIAGNLIGAIGTLSTLKCFAAGEATAAVAAGASTIGMVATIATAAIFVYTTTNAVNKYTFSRKYPLGVPSSIMDATLQYYMQENASTENGYLNERSESWIQRAFSWKLPKTNTKIDSTAVYEHFPEKLLDFNEKGWLAAYDRLLNKYANDPTKLYNAYLKMQNDFVDAFWKESPEVQKQYVRKACMKYVEIGMTCRMNNGTTLMETSIMELAEQFSMPDNSQFNFTADAKTDWERVQRDLIDKATELKMAESENRNGWGIDPKLIGIDPKLIGLGSSVSYEDVWKAVFEDWDQNDPDFEMRLINKADKSAFHDKYIGILNSKMGPLMHDYYDKKHRQAMNELNDILYNTIVPLLNTRLTFYAQDLNHPNDRAYNALIASGARRVAFKFDCDEYKPNFLPANHTVGSLPYSLKLLPNPKNSVLLETTVYHYLMYGCPTKAALYTDIDEEPSQAMANWQDVKLETDPNLPTIVRLMHQIQDDPAGKVYVEYNPLEFKGTVRNTNDDNQGIINLLELNITDTKIPVEFRADVKQKKKENQGKVVWEGPIIPTSDYNYGSATEEELQQLRESGLPWGVMYE